MKKYILPVLVVAAFGVYILFTNQNSGTTVLPQPSTGTDGTGGIEPTPTPTSTPTSSGGGTPTPTPTPTPAPQGAFKDGTYTGPVTDAFYGKIQVVAVVKGGKITSVNVPVFPNSPGETTLVNQNAIPKLKQEAIVAQSAKIDVVSGATQTSEGFQQSLSSALASAAR